MAQSVGIQDTANVGANAADWLRNVPRGLDSWRLSGLAHGATFDAGNALMILGASFMAWLLDDFAELRDKWKNA